MARTKQSRCAARTSTSKELKGTHDNPNNQTTAEGERGAGKQAAGIAAGPSAWEAKSRT